MQDLDSVAPRTKVPSAVRSCHTATAGTYIVEGHVPAAVVTRLLQDRPDVVGIGVPEMPAGSPGMESPYPVPYQVLAWRDGRPPFVYASVAANGTITY